MKNNKILIHSIVFSPDGVSTAYLYNDIALKFKSSGYEVVVLTTTPHYNVVESELSKQPLKPQGLGLYYVSDYKGIKVIHVPQKKFKSGILRVLGFVYWHILSLLIGLFERDVQLILSPSPPLTIGFINLVIGKMKGAKVIYNVQEIYPDFLINQGKLKLKPAISFLKWLERLVYNKSDAVITIDKVFYQTIVDRFKERGKLKVIPNFVDTSLFRPKSLSESNLDRTLFPKKDEVLKIMYAGNIGHAQDWEPLVDVAKHLVNEKVEFWVIGEGVMKDWLKEQVDALGLTNIHILPYQNRDSMPDLIAYADLHFIFMSPAMEGQGFPSKVYTILACSKPLLVISGDKTPICNFLKPLNCAYLITEKEYDVKCSQLVSVIKEVLFNKAELEEKGLNGYNHIESIYSKEVVTGQYVFIAEQLIHS